MRLRLMLAAAASARFTEEGEGGNTALFGPYLKDFRKICWIFQRLLSLLSFTLTQHISTIVCFWGIPPPPSVRTSFKYGPFGKVPPSCTFGGCDL